MRKVFVLLWAVVLLAVWQSCKTDGGSAPCTGENCIIGGGGDGTPTPIPTIAGGKSGQIYLSSKDGSGAYGIFRFQGAISATGNIAPTATIQGTTTGLSGTQSIFVDSAANRLFAANLTDGKILVFDSVSTKSGNVAPNRVIQSTSIINPQGIFVDVGNDRLYVTNSLNPPFQVAAIASASTADGSVVAVATENPGGAKAFNQPHGLFVDASDRLYVADTGTGSVKVFSGVKTWATTGQAVDPVATLSGDKTLLNEPVGVTIDAGGNLVVTDQGANSVLIFAGASTLSGSVNVAPIRTISGAKTTFNAPQQAALVPGSDLVFVTNSAGNSLLAFGPYTTITGNVAPSLALTGAATGLVTVYGLALDLTR